MSLQCLSDQELVIEAKLLVERERSALAEVLKALREIERRKLYLERGFSSLFEFCMVELQYSPAEAHVRIQAMRLIWSLPEAEEKIANGTLSLTVAASAQGAFRRQEKMIGRPIPLEEKGLVVRELVGVTARDAEKRLIVRYPEAGIVKEAMRAIAEDQTRISFVASKQLMEKLGRLKALLAHKNFSGRMDILVEQMADVTLAKFDPLKPRRNDAPKPAPKRDSRSRYVPYPMRRQVWRQAEGRCQFVDPQTGRRCSGQHALQIDHIQELSQGGRTELANLRLLCSAHNQWRPALRGV